MTTKEIFELLKLQFASAEMELADQEEAGGDPFIKVAGGNLVEVCQFLKSDPRLDFKMCHSVSGVDYKETLMSVLHLYSLGHKHKVVIKTECPVEDPTIPSVSSVWNAANWHERESFDLLGITYEGHPDLRRILLADDWEGHPLRKDYELPDDSMFPWDGVEVPVPEPEPEARPTAPGADGGTLERPSAEG